MEKAIDYTRIAEIYDIYVDTDFDIPFFLKEAKKYPAKVLEMMSGTGRVSIPLIETGIDLSCLDNSPEMLNIFRNKLKERNLSARIYEMDVCEMSLDKKFPLIFIPFHSFSEILSPADQHKTLASIYQHLTINGRFVCTLHNPQIRLKQANGQLRLVKECPLGKDQGSLLLKISEEYNPSAHIVNGLQIFEIHDENRMIKSKIELNIQFYMHTKHEFENLVKSAGFKVVDLYGDYDYAEFVEPTSPFMIWILGK